MQRFPVILNTMVVDKTTATFDADRKVWTGYVGSFVGGPIYVRNEGATFTTTISLFPYVVTDVILSQSTATLNKSS